MTPQPHSAPPIENEAFTLPDDPSALQQLAADPDVSVWVNASAGTGKTKVLVDRVLRLLLPRPDGRPGARPHKILCLTYTKAAAGEMTLRLHKQLQEWAVCKDEVLFERLKNLIGEDPSLEMAEAARRLFTTVIDAPGGLQILTIHAFCQSILGRFPLEAGVPPHFQLATPETLAPLLDKAMHTVLKEDSYAAAAYTRLAIVKADEDIFKMIRGIISKRQDLEELLEPFQTPDDLYAAQCVQFNIGPGETAESLINAFVNNVPEVTLKRIAAAFAQGAKTDQERSIHLYDWLSGDTVRRAHHFARFTPIFLNNEGDIRAKPSNNACTSDPDLETLRDQIGLQLIELNDRVNALAGAQASTDVLWLSRVISERYEMEKHKQALLDYDDLIHKTKTLLAGSAQAIDWVMFKLDGGIDHILVDEAQDTNPAQWDILDALTDDFFSGRSRHEEATPPTLFVVGDGKQSIYSFQGADVNAFHAWRLKFAGKVRAGNRRWREIPLNSSFRTVPAILNLTDSVFSSHAGLSALGSSAEEHHRSTREGQAGRITLWPVFASEKAAALEPWTPPITLISQQSGKAALANHIAQNIQSWIGREKLESRDRYVQAGDILILLRNRGDLAPMLIRALKGLGIPVSGADRLIVGEHIAIKDLLALARFALQPKDDLNLACILKSPFIAMDEEQLMRLATGRNAKGTLWSHLRDNGTPKVVAWLDALIRNSRRLSPYMFFQLCLSSPCPADSISGHRALHRRLGEDCFDPLTEFLQAVLTYEKTEAPYLQNFLIWQDKNPLEIKRQMDDAQGQVRIMTVHGAKGLQAPIVIMPDTMMSAKIDRLLWPDMTGLRLPVYTPSNDTACPVFKAAFAQAEKAYDYEYRRLLYVAMTRAEDRLYVGGATNTKPKPQSWYCDIEAALAGADGISIEEAREAHGPYYKEFTRQITFDEPRTKAPDRIQKDTQNEAHDAPLPDWVFNLPGKEPDPPRPLVASRPSEDMPPARSPLQRDDPYRFRRGQLTHSLLQFLPDIAPSLQAKSGTLYLDNFGQDLPEDIRTNILKEVFAILNDPEYEPLFGRDSFAEVPVSGLVGRHTVNARLDRLLVREKDIWIVDYKTNRPSPQEATHIPVIYREQIRRYSALLTQIYPGRHVRCFLLWTDGPKMMEIDVSDTAA